MMHYPLNQCLKNISGMLDLTTNSSLSSTSSEAKVPQRLFSKLLQYGIWGRKYLFSFYFRREYSHKYEVLFLTLLAKPPKLRKKPKPNTGPATLRANRYLFCQVKKITSPCHTNSTTKQWEALLSVLWWQHKSEALQCLTELRQRYNLANTFTVESFTWAAACVSFACFHSHLPLYATGI